MRNASYRLPEPSLNDPATLPVVKAESMTPKPQTSSQDDKQMRFRLSIEIKELQSTFLLFSRTTRIHRN
jgi:hypothetical protein